TGFRVTDPDQFTATQINPRLFGHGWDGAYRPNDPDFVVTNAADYLEARGAPNLASFSTDGGVTWDLFPNLRRNHPTELKFGNIAPGVSDTNFPANIVWVPAKGATPYFSNDDGATWTKATGWIKDGAGNDRDTGIINEFVKIQGLVAHPEDAGVYYYVAPNLGLTKSIDGGDNWSLLFDNFTGFGFNSRLLIDPSDTDTLWYAHGQQSPSFRSGLWRSDDGGVNFAELLNVDYAIDVSLGAPAPGSDLETLYLVGVVEGEQGIFRSLDDGLSWEEIGHFATGLIAEPDRIEASMETFGLVYLGIEGTGFVYGQLAAEAVAGDYNGDGLVNGEDYAVWRGAFGATSGEGLDADGNGDGVVDGADYTLWRDAEAAFASASIPEPTSAMLLIFGSVATFGRPRRPPMMSGFGRE
ncbi:MAG: dockerin type I domain-containing protein, partial [Planctomycetota bacterium]